MFPFMRASLLARVKVATERICALLLLVLALLPVLNAGAGPMTDRSISVFT